MNTESFVMYESVFKQFDRLNKRLGNEVSNNFIKAIMEYGLYGVVPDEEDEIWLYGLEQAITSIDAAKARRAKNIEDGNKGGRPRKDLDMDEIDEQIKNRLPLKLIAGYHKVSVDTIQRRKKELEAAKPQNLNVNVNENENENENVNENYLAKEGKNVKSNM